MKYVKGSYTKDNAENTKDAFEAGRIISLFHVLLKDVDSGKCIDTLKDFHNLPYRIKDSRHHVFLINVSHLIPKSLEHEQI